MRAPDVFIAVLRDPNGLVFSVPFVGTDREQVLWACQEIYPDSQVVSLSLDGQWGSDDRATDCDAALG